MTVVRLVDIRESPLSLDEVYAAVTDPAAGGICLFVGTVRDHDGGQAVSALGYSSHPTAVARLRDVAERIAGECDVVALAGVHRVGDLAIGDLAVVVGASAAHRADAFEACRRLIDELKADVPVWKHQTFVSGEAEWVHPDQPA
ncbi:molybdenum cofactor biosynthesis protein MoaE [Aeromicrobium fastidiosum]|uniref:Molybdopterin synthase catalytic subunit 1 n=1 Tax=Aeromicrobium fastidiosum TaxID=52699 RepID=A0A641AII7_9ACTN|nr:molybdenum cofactor biosynthesis protein MoaE [Aeromicrobium fastidiosum]KAA1373043.1 molybdenum cofactor biosynthesis protein MoaE [Aeromicrobium fastidiosum]MBP2391023.1 molybdopterin synthase catalytic subunit [Aeromicrobium fastidiosum]